MFKFMISSKHLVTAVDKLLYRKYYSVRIILELKKQKGKK